MPITKQQLIITIEDRGEKGQKVIMDFEPVILRKADFDKLTDMEKMLQQVAVLFANTIAKLTERDQNAESKVTI